jgi:ferredoxin-type protein NapH
MVIEQIPKTVGFIYALVMVVVCAALWYSGRWSRRTGYGLLVISLGLGFLILAPIMPYQFQMLVLRDTQGLGGPLIAGVLGLGVILILSVIFGRFYCGYLCPVGAAQEAVSRVSPYALRKTQKTLSGAVRLGVLGAFLLSLRYSGFLCPLLFDRFSGVCGDTARIRRGVPALLPLYLPVRCTGRGCRDARGL